MKFRLQIFLLCLGIISISCDPDPEDEAIVPKPKAYHRISYPKHEYKAYDSICPYAFETPVYSIVLPDFEANTEPCWVNVYYPKFGAVLHVSYKVVDGNLETYLRDSDEFAKKHVVKANGMDENPIIRDSARVYGLMYDIKGNAASNLQFYVTDSANHFVRGSLYFAVPPNIDSLEPSVKFIREDIIHLIQTFRWKETRLKLKVRGEIKKQPAKNQ